MLVSDGCDLNCPFQHSNYKKIGLVKTKDTEVAFVKCLFAFEAPAKARIRQAG